MNNALKSYDTSDEEYKTNLEKEIVNCQRIRRFDDEKIFNNQQAADYKLEQTIQEFKIFFSLYIIYFSLGPIPIPHFMNVN